MRKLSCKQKNDLIKSVFQRIQLQLPFLFGPEVAKLVIDELKFKDTPQMRNKIAKGLYNWKKRYNIQTKRLPSAIGDVSRQEDISVDIIATPAPEPEVCRLCAATSASLHPDQLLKCFDSHPGSVAEANELHSSSTVIANSNVADVLNQHFWFKLHPDRDVGAVVCRQCWSKLDAFHQFYRSVHSMYEQFELDAQLDPFNDVVQGDADHNEDKASDELGCGNSNSFSAANIELPPIDIKAECEDNDCWSSEAGATSTRDIGCGSDGLLPSETETASRDEEAESAVLADRCGSTVEIHTNNINHPTTEDSLRYNDQLLVVQHQNQPNVRTKRTNMTGHLCHICPDRHFTSHGKYNRHSAAIHSPICRSVSTQGVDS